MRLHAQDLPFQSIPEPQAELTATTSVVRMIEGLGFRYYWVTEGLTEDDLAYRPTPEAQSALETIVHMYHLTATIKNITLNQPSIRPVPEVDWSFEELRAKTLDNLWQARANLLAMSDQEFEELKVMFDREGTVSSFPVWHLINGPITDAIYHSGQIVSFRRTTGNPIRKGVNVFLGVQKD